MRSKNKELRVTKYELVRTYETRQESRIRTYWKIEIRKMKYEYKNSVGLCRRIFYEIECVESQFNSFDIQTAW